MNKKIAQKLIYKTKDDYNRIASHFDSTRKYNWREISEAINLMAIKKGSRVLDLGCGGGRLYEILEKYNVDYVGFDNSEKLINIAKKKYPRAKFQVGDLVQLRSKEKYDYVFSIATLHHIPSKKIRKKAIENIKIALKPGGKALVSVWYFWNQPKYIKEIIIQFFSTANSKLKIKNCSLPFGDLYVPWKDPSGKVLAERYHHAWTARELKRQGFKIVSKKKNLVGIYNK